MKKKKPEIRFNGFEGQWVRNNLNFYLTVSSEKNQEGQYSKYDIYSVSREYGVINQIEYQGKSFAGASLLNYSVVQTEDIVYTKSPLKAQPYGIIKVNSGKSGIVSALYGVFHPQESVCSYFVQVYFNLDHRLNSYLRPLVNKGAKNTLLISDADALQGEVIFPSRDEQEKLVSFFTTLDKLIAKLEAKLDKLRKLKQALLEKMFVNVNGGGYETQEIRFKGYTDKWQVKELREVATKHSMSNQHVHHQNLLSLSYGKIKRKDINSDKGLLPASFDTYQMVKEGVVVMRFTDLQNDKKSLRVGLAKEEGIISPAYVCIYGKESINADFLYQELHYYDSILKLFYSMGDGMRQTLSYTDITTIPISTPQMEEQKKIVDLYDTLDRKITQISTKLTKLRNIKQSLLQKMFA